MLRPSLPSLLVLTAFSLLPRPVRAQSADAARQAKTKYEACEKYFNVGDYVQALGDCKAAYLLDPEPDYLYSIAQVYRFSGDPADAVHFYRIYLAKVGSTLPENKRQAVEKLVEEQEAAEAARTAPPTGTSSAEPSTSRPVASSAPIKTAHSSEAVSTMTPAPSSDRRPAWATDPLGDVLLAAGAAGLVAGGVSFVLANGNVQAARTAPTLDGFYANEQTARDRRTFGDWASGIGGAIFLGGIVHLALHHPSGPASPSVAAIALPGGMAVSVAGGFR